KVAGTAPSASAPIAVATRTGVRASGLGRPMGRSSRRWAPDPHQLIESQQPQRHDQEEHQAQRRVAEDRDVADPGHGAGESAAIRQRSVVLLASPWVTNQRCEPARRMLRTRWVIRRLWSSGSRKVTTSPTWAEAGEIRSSITTSPGEIAGSMLPVSTVWGRS